jgi:hypothetical protein
MTKFSLIDNDNGVCTYKCNDTNEVSQFRAHPTEPFEWIIMGGDYDTAFRIIEAYITQGMKQHQYAGGFEEAVRELSI